MNLTRASSKVILDKQHLQQKHNFLQRFIRRCSCNEQVKNKIYEGYYYMPGMSQKNIDAQTKNKSVSESNILNIVNSERSIENDYGSFGEWDVSSKNMTVKKRTLSASLTAEKVLSTSSSLIYSKETVDEEEEDLMASEVTVPVVNETKKVIKRSEMFRITRIVVRSNEVEFEEKAQLVKLLNEQMEEYWLNCKYFLIILNE